MARPGRADHCCVCPFIGVKRSCLRARNDANDPLRNSAVSADCGAALPRRGSVTPVLGLSATPKGIRRGMISTAGRVRFRSGTLYDQAKAGTPFAMELRSAHRSARSRSKLPSCASTRPRSRARAASISHSISGPSRRMRRPCSLRCSRTAPLRQPTRRPWPR
jgi:hypothetical protein